MKRFFIIALAFAVVLISAFFLAEKFFPAETYLLKNFIYNNSKNSFPAPEKDFFELNSDLSNLIENGAILNDSLLLINETHPLPENYSPELIDLGGIYINLL